MKGCSWAHLGRSQEAVDALNRALRIQPKYKNKISYLEILAVCYCRLDQIEMALETYLAAENLSPNNSEFAFRVGWALGKLERYQ